VPITGALRRQRQPCARPRRGRNRDIVLLTPHAARAGWLALPAVRGALARARHLHSSRPSAVSRNGRSFSLAPCATSARRVVHHRYRFKPEDWGAGRLASLALAVTGACMYVTARLSTPLACSTSVLPMAYEDVDWCLVHGSGLPRPVLPANPLPPRVGPRVDRPRRARGCIVGEQTKGISE